MGNAAEGDRDVQILCQMFDHKPDKAKVWHDGLDFRCLCKRCRLPLIRDLEGWRPFEPTTDGGAGHAGAAATPDA